MKKIILFLFAALCVFCVLKVLLHVQEPLGNSQLASVYSETDQHLVQESGFDAVTISTSNGSTSNDVVESVAVAVAGRALQENSPQLVLKNSSSSNTAALATITTAKSVDLVPVKPGFGGGGGDAGSAFESLPIYKEESPVEKIKIEFQYCD